MTREPAWLTLEAVLAIHEELIAAFGGAAGIRDRRLLESALDVPRNKFLYGEMDVHALAAAYAFALVRNHPFIDGHKRLGFVAAYTFLGINRWGLDPPEPEVVTAMLGLSDRSISEAQFSAWLRSHSTPIKKSER